MLSFLKKPSDKQSAAMVPAWHPNFRIIERLPDTKAIRTSFFVNGVAVFITLALLTYVLSREYELSSLRSDTASVLSTIQANRPGSEQAVGLFKQFQEEEKKVVALQEFLSTSRFVASDFILQLGESLPPSISLVNIDCKPAAVTLKGRIDGAPDEASGRATAYIDALRKNSYFSGLFESISLTNVVRDPTTNKIQFVIDLKSKASPKKPEGKKGKK
jgi:hypothetical protein